MIQPYHSGLFTGTPWLSHCQLSNHPKWHGQNKLVPNLNRTQQILILKPMPMMVHLLVQIQIFISYEKILVNDLSQVAWYGPIFGM